MYRIHRVNGDVITTKTEINNTSSVLYIQRVFGCIFYMRGVKV